MLESAILLTITIALLSAFVMLLLNKWNYFEKFRLKFDKEPCMFCHCFWLNWLSYLILIVFLIPFDDEFRKPLLCLTPFMATPITWYISVR
jgi:hypothetical protein